MPPIYLIARREYLAYVTAWGFWLSLLTAPLLFAALVFTPVLLARAEPPRALVVLAERPGDAALVRGAFEAEARQQARAELQAYLDAAAPHAAAAVLSAFDAAHDNSAALSAARAEVARVSPRALSGFPSPAPRYYVVASPAPSIEALKPYLSGARAGPGGEALFGALNIRRDEANAPVVEYWSANLQQNEPSEIARAAMRLEMRREALAARGLGPAEADALDALDPAMMQFDPRPSAPGGEVTRRARAPYFAAIALALVLWTVVFSVANMLLSGVIEEKSNKILDALLTSVAPIEMLVGKLLGVAAVSVTLFVFWGALGGALASFAAGAMSQSFLGQIAGAFLEPRLLATFVIGFVSGYLMFGAIFLALGALCDSIQEAQTLLGPVTILLMLPMLLLGPAIDNPNSPIIAAASWFPLFTPFLMLMRAPIGLGWGEIAGQGALMAATVIALLWLAARVFHAGVVNQVSLAGLFRRKRAHE